MKKAPAKKVVRKSEEKSEKKMKHCKTCSC